MSSETAKETKDRKVGVYICHCGGNISDHVDVQKLADGVRGCPGVKVARTNMFMCSDPGQELIQEDIKSGKIDRVVVASCAPSLHETTFRGAIKRAEMSPYLYEHANIREQVSWVHDGEKATRKATALVSAAVAKAKNLEALEPIRVDAKNHATVIGAGVAGLRAALDLAQRGIAVALLEKSPFLGGQMANLQNLVPTGESAEDVIRELAGAVCAEPLIQVHTCSEVTHFEGYIGNFSLTVTSCPPQNDEIPKNAQIGSYLPFAGFYPAPAPQEVQKTVLSTGVVVLATGFRTYVPQKGEYGFGDLPAVITLPDLIREMADSDPDGGAFHLHGRPIRRMAFVHCVGSRQIPGIHEPDAEGNLNEYCSRTCCSATLQAAIDIRERFPQTHVFEYYRDIRTYGRGQEDIYDQASAGNVTFFRFEADAPPMVEKADSSEYPLQVTVKDTLTFGETLTAEVDLVVLAVGMQPNRISELVEMMKLPVGADRFLQEVHPKLRPVEMAVTGILLAGTCQAPMDVGEACSGAQAAAVKAAALLSKGYVELDPYVAAVDLERCDGTGRCVEVCPEEAVHLKQVQIAGETVNRAEINPALCTGCGICVAECPQNAIDVKGWTLKQYEEMVDVIAAA
jgi:heterodisulfide reductase subunit A